MPMHKGNFLSCGCDAGDVGVEYLWVFSAGGSGDWWVVFGGRHSDGGPRGVHSSGHQTGVPGTTSTICMNTSQGECGIRPYLQPLFRVFLTLLTTPIEQT